MLIFYIIALVLFFLVGPHKVYEWIFWALLGLGCYSLIHEMTFVAPDFTRTLFLGNIIVENRGTLLWISKVLVGVLFFVTPMTLGLNVAWVVRDTLWFFIKVILLSAFFVIFWVAVVDLLFSAKGVVGEIIVIPGFSLSVPYIKNSIVYGWISDKSYIIILAWFILGFYKILFSHWISRIALFGGIVYAKGNDIFGKRTFDIPPHEDHDSASDMSHEAHDGHGH